MKNVQFVKDAFEQFLFAGSYNLQLIVGLQHQSLCTQSIPLSIIYRTSETWTAELVVDLLSAVLTTRFKSTHLNNTKRIKILHTLTTIAHHVTTSIFCCMSAFLPTIIKHRYKTNINDDIMQKGCVCLLKIYFRHSENKLKPSATLYETWRSFSSEVPIVTVRYQQSENMNESQSSSYCRCISNPCISTTATTFHEKWKVKLQV